jgi:hypothetical protein
MAIGCGPGDFRPCHALIRDAYRGFMSQIRQEAAKPPAAPARRPRPAGRRVGYLIAVVVNAALLFVLNGQPGWQDVPFLTSATSQVLGLVNLSLAVGLAVNLVYLAYDPPWLKSLGDLLTAGIGLAVPSACGRSSRSPSTAPGPGAPRPCGSFSSWVSRVAASAS